MKLFIAIDIPEDIKDYLLGIQEKLFSSEKGIMLVNKEQIHLTSQ